MTWKEHAHLFANGKFKVKSYLGQIGDIQGCNHGRFLLIDAPKNEWVQVQGATLIARKIEDMSDEEKGVFYDHFNYDRSEESDFRDTKIKVHYRSLLYLLSIGVYPFDQSHFDTGEVINIKTIGE